MFERESYTADQAALTDFARQLGEDFDFSYFFENMKKGESPSRFWRVLGEGGYLGILAPEELGGAGSRVADLVVLIHNLAKNGLASLQLMDQIVCCDLLARLGTPEQRKTYIPEIISGGLCSRAVMEEAEGLDLFDFDMVATPDGDGYRLNGTKRFVVGAKEASMMLVAARTGPADANDPSRGVGLFVLPSPPQGVKMIPREINVRVTGEEELVLITGDRFFDVVFEDVAAPREALLGLPDAAGRALFESFDLLFIALAAMAVGWGDDVLGKAVEYARNRVIFEEPIGSYQAIQHPMVRAKTELELAKLAIGRAVSAYDGCEADVPTYSSVAKYAASEAAYAACDIAIQAHGGYSFDRETGIITLWPLILLSRILPLNNERILERFAEVALGLSQ